MSSTVANSPSAVIETWLVARLADALGVSVEEIDARAPLNDYGLGSVEALALVGDLEAWLGVALEPTLLWDHDTLAALAVHVARSQSGVEGAQS